MKIEEILKRDFASTDFLDMTERRILIEKPSGSFITGVLEGVNYVKMDDGSYLLTLHLNMMTYHVEGGETITSLP